MTIKKKGILVANLLVAMLLCGISYFAIENVLPYASIKPFKMNAASLFEFRQGILPSDFGLEFEHLTFQTKDSLTLRGYWIKADTPRGTVVLIHGITDCKEHLYPLCQRLKEIGVQSIIFDLRAHGQSDGMYCTFGYLEKNDIDIIVDSLIQRNIKQPIGIYGNSLGGAVALQVLGENKKLKFGIIESTFDEFPKVALEYGEEFIGIRSESLTNHVLKKSGEIAHFDPFKVKPVVSCAAITCPIFMSHGDSDKKIPVSFGENNFRALKTNDKQFIHVKDAGHTNLHTKGGMFYWEMMKKFILKNTESVDSCNTDTEGGLFQLANK